MSAYKSKSTHVEMAEALAQAISDAKRSSPAPADGPTEDATGEAEQRGGMSQSGQSASSTPQPQWKCIDGNTAAAMVAYFVSDAAYIYPITPSSTMGEVRV
eukprot:769632-Pyramimonas_sp.AAC.2